MNCKLVYECLKKLNTLSSHNKVLILHVLGHSGAGREFEGDEAAEELARKGQFHLYTNRTLLWNRECVRDYASKKGRETDERTILFAMGDLNAMVGSENTLLGHAMLKS